METKKKLSLVTGAALAVFSAGVVHATELAKTYDLTGSFLVAEGSQGCGGKEGGCSKDANAAEHSMKKKHHKAKGHKGKHQGSKHHEEAKPAEGGDHHDEHHE